MPGHAGGWEHSLDQGVQTRGVKGNARRFRHTSRCCLVRRHSGGGFRSGFCCWIHWRNYVRTFSFFAFGCVFADTPVQRQLVHEQIQETGLSSGTTERSASIIPWLDTRSVSARAAFAPREKQIKRECVSMWTDIHLHLFYDRQLRRK
jgi:hypothetical protein